MKKLIFISFATMMALPVFAQEDNLKKLENLENNTETKTETKTETRTETITQNDRDTVVVKVGNNGNEIFSVKEHGDETQIKIGKKEYRFVDDGDGVRIYKSYDDSRSNGNRHSRFRGHLGGFEMGYNSFLSDFWSTSLAPEDSYFDLNTGKSYFFNFLLPSVNIGFTKHFGISATIGIDFNKYRFDNNNTIDNDEFGVIHPVYPLEGITYSKSKLATTYATLPVILEVQIPLANPNKTINIGAGVIGAAKLGSHTKVVYYTGGKEKEKNKDDFSLNAFRWGATGRVGYEFFQVYGTCYFTQMFEKNKGPELYPFEVGIAFTFDD